MQQQTSKKLPKTRKKAKLLKINKYNTGKPCKHKHLADRYTATGGCVSCSKRYTYLQREKLKDRFFENNYLPSPKINIKDIKKISLENLTEEDYNAIKELVYAKKRTIDRRKASRMGLTRYYTAVPCVYGHDSTRFVRSCVCVECYETEKPIPKKFNAYSLPYLLSRFFKDAEQIELKQELKPDSISKCRLIYKDLDHRLYHKMTSTEARELSLSVYFSGEKCSEKHYSLRNTKNNKCVKCSQSARLAYF